MSVCRVSALGLGVGCVVLAAVLAGCPAPEVAVPDVVGMLREDVAVALAVAGLNVGTVGELYSEDQPAGAVLEQEPSAGTIVERNSAVSLLFSKGPGPTAENPVAVPVGAVLPLSGAWSTLGQDGRAAVSLSVEMVNAYLRPSGYQLALTVYDSGSDPAAALAALEELDAAGVKVVIGPMTSAEAEAMVGYADAHGITLISPSSTAAALAQPDNLLRLLPNDLRQAEALAMMAARAGYTRVLPVFVDDLYGRGLVDGVRAAGEAQGLTVLEGLPYAAGIGDFSGTAAALESLASAESPEATAVLLAGSDADAVGLFNALAAASPLAGYKWYAGESVVRQARVLSDPASRALAAATGLEGFTFSWESNIIAVQDKLAAALVSAELGAAPSTLTMQVMPGVWCLGEALRLTEGATDHLWASFRYVADHSTLATAGPAALDDNGDMMSALYYAYRAVASGAWEATGLYIEQGDFGPYLLEERPVETAESGVAVIGAVLPLTGANAELGTGALEAMRLAVAHANQYTALTQGLGLTFALDARDSRSDPATALAQVEALYARGVRLVLGPLTSAELAAAEGFINMHDMVCINTNSTAPALAQPDYIIRLTPDDTHTARAVARMVGGRELTDLTVLYIDDDFGWGFAQAAADAFEGNVLALPYAPGTTDFTQVLSVAAAHVELVSDTAAVLLVGLEEVVDVLAQVPVGPLTEVPWFGNDVGRRAILANTAARATGVRTGYTVPVYDIAGKQTFMPMQQAVKVLLEPALGGPMTWNELSAYDAAWMAASAHLKTGVNPDAGALWQALHGFLPPDAIGVGANYAFDENDDQSYSYYAFNTLTPTDDGAEWVLNGIYRDDDGVPDNVVTRKSCSCDEQFTEAYNSCMRGGIPIHEVCTLVAARIYLPCMSTYYLYGCDGIRKDLDCNMGCFANNQYCNDAYENSGYTCDELLGMCLDACDSHGGGK